MLKIFENLNIKVDIMTSCKINFKEYSFGVDLEYHGGATVRIFQDSTVEAYDNSTVRAYSNSTVRAYDNSTVEAYDNSTVRAYSNSTVRAYSNSTVEAYDNSTVEAYDNSTVEAYDNSTVRAYSNSTVEAYSNSTVEASGFTIIRKCSSCVSITKNSDFVTEVSAVRKFKKKTVVYKMVRAYGENVIAKLECPRGQEFQSKYGSKCRTSKAKVLGFYDLEQNKLSLKTATSLYDLDFLYKVGEIAESHYDTDIDECSEGIHFYLTFKEAANHV